MAQGWRDLDNALDSHDENSIVSALEELTLSSKAASKDTKYPRDLLPKLTYQLNHENPEIQAGAARVIAQLLENASDIDKNEVKDLAKSINSKSLLDLKKSNKADEVFEKLHTGLCEIITALQVKYVEQLMPEYKKLGPYMVECTTSTSYPIATAACAYWQRLPLPPIPSKLTDAWVPPVLKNLGKLIPALLQNMVYHEDHIEYIKSKSANADENDMPEHIEQLSNHRNFAAMGLENICRIFPTESISVFLPHMDRWLKSSDWRETEAILLALGAFLEAVGTPKQIEGVLPELVARLMDLYKHEEPLVRAINCFTMQQFINIKLKKDPTARMIKSTISLLTDKSHEVQDMALRLLAAILAWTERDIAPFAAKLTAAFEKVNSLIKGNLRYSYYECIGHFFGRMGVLLEPKDVETLLNPLLEHWDSLQFNNASTVEETLNICQPLCVVAMYSKHLFAPYNDRIFDRVVPYFNDVVGGSNGHGNGEADYVTKYMVACLDLLSNMCEGQGKSIKPHVSKHNLVLVLLKLLQSKTFTSAVAGSALALLGHLCRNFPDEVAPHLDKLLDVLNSHLDISSDNFEIINNALWTLGNMAQSVDPKNEDLLQFCDRLSKFVEQDNLDISIMIHAVLALTSLGSVWPDKVILTLQKEHIFTQCCVLLQAEFPPGMEKEVILKQLCSILSQHMKKIPKDLWVHFCVSAVLFDTRDESLKQTLQSMLNKIRSEVGGKSWGKINQQMGSQLSYSMRRKYKMY